MRKYVANSTSRLKKVLMSPPNYFELEPINVIADKWLNEKTQVNKEKCIAEHKGLVEAYRQNGVEVELLECNPELKYQVFARDFGACIAEGYIMGSFREPVRKGETAVYEKKMKQLGIPCVARCTAGAFEGGDFFFLDDYVMAHGIIARTDLDGFNNVQRQVRQLGYEMVGVPCHSDYLHLDMCFNIVAEKVAVVCLDALPYQFIKMLEKRKFTLVNISKSDVMKHFGNIQCLGDGRVLSVCSNTIVNKQLRTMGLNVLEVELEEILKGGGGIHCMTFPLERV